MPWRAVPVAPWSPLNDGGPGFRPGNQILIEVPDTTAALQDLARFVRRESSATVIAITGSAGKTTTKETIAALLESRYQVAKNKGNLNNHLGLPLSLLELRRGADVAVMELGMNHAGELRLLVGIAEPEIRVWTNVGDAHLGYFASREVLADAKAEILENASAADVIVVNADDPLVMSRAAAFEGRAITFGTSPNADVRAEAVEDLGLDGMRFRIHTADASAEATIPLIGRGNLLNVLAAAAVALELGVPLDEIVAASRIAVARPASRCRRASARAESRCSTTPITPAPRLSSARSRRWRTNAAPRERPPCSARCWSLATTRWSCTSAAAAPPRPRGSIA